MSSLLVFEAFILRKYFLSIEISDYMKSCSFVVASRLILLPTLCQPCHSESKLIIIVVAKQDSALEQYTKSWHKTEEQGTLRKHWKCAISCWTFYLTTLYSFEAPSCQVVKTFISYTSHSALTYFHRDRIPIDHYRIVMVENVSPSE